MLTQRVPFGGHLRTAAGERNGRLRTHLGRLVLPQMRSAHLVELEVDQRQRHPRPAAEDGLAGQLPARTEPLAHVLKVLLDLVRRLEPEE